jgi:malate dehydrogenase
LFTYLTELNAQGLPIDDFSKSKLEQTGQELMEEREEAFAVCAD